MCKIYQDANEDEELSIEQIEKVFDIFKSLGIVYVSIGGGEPILRKDLPLVVELLIRKGFMVRLLTNGTFCDEYLIRNLVSMGLREVSISLDTLDSEKQAYICNCEGAWEKTMRSIELFSNLLSKNRRLLLINTVVSPFNIKELPELSQFAKEKDYYISFVPIETENLYEFAFKQDDYKSIDESYDYLIRMKRKGKSYIFNSSLFLDKSRQYLKSAQQNWQCDAGRLYFSMNPKGEFSICHKFGGEISLLKSNFKDFFKSKEFEDRRRSLIEGCPGCMRPCWAEVSFLLKDMKSLREIFKIQVSNLAG
jgi:MoaA/NifB/PqqE/SkfB family radical SAM enzyme